MTKNKLRYTQIHDERSLINLRYNIIHVIIRLTIYNIFLSRNVLTTHLVVVIVL